MNDALENLIDAHGLSAVLLAIAGICAEKADHIRASYDNSESLARGWNAAGVRVATCATSRAVTVLPC